MFRTFVALVARVKTEVLPTNVSWTRGSLRLGSRKQGAQVLCLVINGDTQSLCCFRRCALFNALPPYSSETRLVQESMDSGRFEEAPTAWHFLLWRSAGGKNNNQDLMMATTLRNKMVTPVCLDQEVLRSAAHVSKGGDQHLVRPETITTCVKDRRLPPSREFRSGRSLGSCFFSLGNHLVIAMAKPMEWNVWRWKMWFD
jgi:hypothetical protein